MHVKVKPSVKNLVRTRVPTRHGEFILYYYTNNIDNKEHVALIQGNVSGTSNVPVRVHSECFTGDILGSRRCDCGEQLQISMRVIDNEGCGVVIYLRQEGRGIGLLEKLKAYNLQDQGLDTVDANIHLGYRPDERDYSIAALILEDLQVRSIRLITNNPRKISELKHLGIKVKDRIPIIVPGNQDNESYLKTKAEKMNHLLKEDVCGNTTDELSFIQPLFDELQLRKENASPPFVTLSYAQSIDGSISIRSSDTYPLSCRKSLEMTHLMRSHHDALLVGVNTILIDNPRLTVRYCEGDNPQPVILDSLLRFPEHSRLLDHPSKAPIIITTDQAPEDKRQILRERGVRIFTVSKNDEGRVDLAAALDLLSNLDMNTIMVEGGASIINQFLKSERVNYVIVTIVPQIIGGLKAVENLCRSRNLPPLTIADCQFQPLDSDLIIYGPLNLDSSVDPP